MYKQFIITYNLPVAFVLGHHLHLRISWPFFLCRTGYGGHGTRILSSSLMFQCSSLELLKLIHNQYQITYRITGIIRGRKVSRIWKHSRMFSCTFNLGRNFYIMRLPESRKLSCELRQRRQFAKLFFRG